MAGEPRGRCPGRRRVRGFTMVELLIVLLILGLVAAVTGPRLMTVYERTRAAMERDDLLRQLQGLGFRAYREGRVYVLDRYPPPPGTVSSLPLELPSGWQLVADPPIRFRPNGACSGGRISAELGGARVGIVLVAPLCQPFLEGSK